MLQAAKAIKNNKLKHSEFVEQSLRRMTENVGLKLLEYSTEKGLLLEIKGYDNDHRLQAASPRGKHIWTDGNEDLVALQGE